MSTTKIDWCDETINPFTGCRNGCEFCYARRFAKRLGGMKGNVYARVQREVDNPFRPAFHIDVSRREEKRLLRSRRPKRVFIGSMGDMCFEGKSLTYGDDGKLLNLQGGWNTADYQAHIARFCSCLESKGHTFLLLTKRPNLLSNGTQWPSNVHIGTSITNDGDARRVIELRNWWIYSHSRPGVIWASVEPLLDPNFDPSFLQVLDWVVIGGQTRPGGLKVDKRQGELIESAKRIVAFLAVSGIPCFVKDNIRKIEPGFDWPREFPNTKRIE